MPSMLRVPQAWAPVHPGQFPTTERQHEPRPVRSLWRTEGLRSRGLGERGGRPSGRRPRTPRGARCSGLEITRALPSSPAGMALRSHHGVPCPGQVTVRGGGEPRASLAGRAQCPHLPVDNRLLGPKSQAHSLSS